MTQTRARSEPTSIGRNQPVLLRWLILGAVSIGASTTLSFFAESKTLDALFVPRVVWSTAYLVVGASLTGAGLRRRWLPARRCALCVGIAMIAAASVTYTSLRGEVALLALPSLFAPVGAYIAAGIVSATRRVAGAEQPGLNTGPDG